MQWLDHREEIIRHLLKQSKRAYAPYSHFRVAAVLVIERAGDVVLVPACNVENASYGLSICAERNAVSRAVAEGLLPGSSCHWRAIAIYSPTQQHVFPCGACRQVLAEFEPNLQVVTFNIELRHEVRSLSQLLPEAFSGQQLAT